MVSFSQRHACLSNPSIHRYHGFSFLKALTLITKLSGLAQNASPLRHVWIQNSLAHELLLYQCYEYQNPSHTHTRALEQDLAAVQRLRTGWRHRLEWAGKAKMHEQGRNEAEARDYNLEWLRRIRKPKCDAESPHRD